MPTVVGDFETRSRCCLDETNIYKYAAHPSTEVLCFAYSIDGGEMQLWQPGKPYPFAAPMDELVIEAFNGEFELTIWNLCCAPQYGWPKLKPEQISCLQARAYYGGMTRGGLDDVCDAVGMGIAGKDVEGHTNMLQLCKPQKAKLVGCEYIGGEFDETLEKHRRNKVYCSNDVRAESILSRLLPPLPDQLQKLWVAHQAINARGVPVDIRMCENAHWMVKREKSLVCSQLPKLTGGRIHTPNQRDKILGWLREHGVNLVDVDGKPSYTKEVVANALETMDLPPLAKDVLTIRSLSKDSAVTKYTAMMNHAESDGRCRAAHVFYKAGPGRFQGMGVNFLNMRRLIDDDIQENVSLADELSTACDPLDLYMRLRESGKGVIPSLGAIVRMAICAGPGKKLLTCDYAGIEYRVLHWMAGDTRELNLIRDFDAGKGVDPYILAAAEIMGKPANLIGKAERQLGKVQRLGCGYLQGGANLQRFAWSQYRVQLTVDRACEIVQLYRRSVPAVRGYWYAVQKAVIMAVNTGRPVGVGPCEYYMHGCTLNCRLPSGRELKYYDPALTGQKDQPEESVFGPELVALDPRSGGRRVVTLPILIENQDQGISFDLLAVAIVKGHAENVPIVLHIYDEGVPEVAYNDNTTAIIWKDIMNDSPAWAKGLPVAAKCDESRRYIK